MKLIVGLGNPGQEYEMTRHNLGFMLIDRLFERAGGRRFRPESSSKVARGRRWPGKRVLLVKPQTFMNLSGDAVRPSRSLRRGQPANVIVASDEVALPFGMIRVEPRGSAGGHNGLKSIIEAAWNTGVRSRTAWSQPDHPVEDLATFVLSRDSETRPRRAGQSARYGRRCDRGCFNGRR